MHSVNDIMFFVKERISLCDQTETLQDVFDDLKTELPNLDTYIESYIWSQLVIHPDMTFMV